MTTQDVEHTIIRRLRLSQPPGYLIDIDKEQLDVTRFETLLDEARQAMATGQLETAVRCFREAAAFFRDLVRVFRE